MTINRFPTTFQGVGIVLETLGGNTIVGNFIGTDPTGTIAQGNRDAGVRINSGNGNIIGGTDAADRNILSGNAYGIYVVGGSGQQIIGNYVGTDRTGKTGLGNLSGVGFFQSSSNQVGGAQPGMGNIISGNLQGGLGFLQAHNNVVQGNIIGLGADGLTPVPNATQKITADGGGGIDIAAQARGNLIGGTTPGSRNIISGNAYAGIRSLSGVFSGVPEPNRVLGNYIGTDITGTLARGNGGAGIHLYSSDLVVGGSAFGEGNLMANNGGSGVLVISQQNFSATGNSIIGNSITGNGAPGVAVVAAAAGFTPTSNAILGNSIRANVGLGIDLGRDGVTLNDLVPTADADTGPNNLQNFPEFSSASISGTTLTVKYLVPSNTAYPLRVEFFKADGDGQEGQTFLGFDIYASVEAGTIKTVSLSVASAVAAGGKIVATATDNAGNTSEFSASQILQSGGPQNSPPVITSNGGNPTASVNVQENSTVVTDVDATDPDAGSTLTYSINGGADAEKFAIDSFSGVLTFITAPDFENPTDSDGNNVYLVTVQVSDGSLVDTQTISVTVTDVAEVCDTVVVNTNDAGAGSLREAINCANVTPNVDRDGDGFTDPDVISFNIPENGLQTISPVTALPTITDAVIIDGYTQPGAMPNTNAIDDPDPSARGLNGVLLVQLSQDPPSAAAMNGLTITGDASTVRGLVINGFTKSGVAINGGKNNVISGNFIGTDSTGAGAAGNGTHGIQINEGATGNVIGTNGDGVNDAAERNLISGNLGAGVELSGLGTSFNIVAGNLIGTNAAGTASLGNANRGVDLHGGAQHNIVGAYANGQHDGAERNLISGNLWEGIGIYDSGTSSNTVLGNYVGTDIAGAAAIANGRSGIAVFGGSTSNVIGGSHGVEGNLFSGNTLDGIEISSAGTADNIITSNLVGTDGSGTLPLGNGRDGVRVWHGAVRTMIGGIISNSPLGLIDNSSNKIAFNKESGVAVLSNDAIGNAIVGNSIFQNGGLGIDLGEDDVTPNDAGDADLGPNNRQNFPEIQHATRDRGALKLTFKVSSLAANAVFPLRVEFFAVDADGREGQTFLGACDYTEGDLAAGGKTFSIATASPVGSKIVATTSDSLSFGIPANTSEFSPSIEIASPWLNPKYRVDSRARYDVTDDTQVIADDVLAIINYINAKGLGEVPDDRANAKPFYDVNGDNNVAADDVIMVINYINAGSAGEAEGEAVSVQERAAGVASSAAVDEVMALLAMDSTGQATRKQR